MISLQGKTLVVVGGGSGIGWAGAQLAVRLGARVVVADLDPAIGQRMGELGPSASFIACDARHAADT